MSKDGKTQSWIWILSLQLHFPIAIYITHFPVSSEEDSNNPDKREYKKLVIIHGSSEIWTADLPV